MFIKQILFNSDFINFILILFYPHLHSIIFNFYFILIMIYSNSTDSKVFFYFHCIVPDTETTKYQTPAEEP